MMKMLPPWIGSCEETAACLSDHLEAGLAPEQERRVRRHLAWCRRCRLLYESLARTVKRGRLVIRVDNAGGIAHALSVSGPGRPEVSTPNIGPGGSTTLTVNLKKPGRYTLWCPIAGHREAGMVTTLVVS